jgi:hypothetical protein
MFVATDEPGELVEGLCGEVDEAELGWDGCGTFCGAVSA